MANNRSRKMIAILVVLGFVGSLGVVAYANKGNIRAAIDQLQGNDFPGPGYGKVKITIRAGDTGEDVANTLVKAGVVKNFRTVYKLILDRNPVFYPGNYTLALEMSSTQAVTALSDPNSGAVETTTIKEGLRASVIFSELAKSTGVPEADFTALFRQPAIFGLNAKLPSVEGYLFPATYNFAPGSSAKQIMQIMIDRMMQELESFNISASDANRVLTLASVIQKEARLHDDFYKVSATFLNRLKVGMHLQSDATVSYGVGGNTVSTSSKDRSARNGYNTYLNAGLPVGPISAPGSVAIDAALHPAVGKWLYFCTVNLKTGETVFSETYAQHEVAVAQWLKWMKENPGYE